MAQFELKITGDLDELADLGVGLSKAGFGQHRTIGSTNSGIDFGRVEVTDADVLQQAEDNLAAAFAAAGRTGHPETDAAAAAPPADKPKRTRKATTADAGPATGAQTFAEQIKEVVASEAATDPTPAASAPAAESAPESGATTTAGVATTASPSDPAIDYKAECQALVKKLMGDSRYSTKDLLDTLESFGGKGVTAIADSAPANLPTLHAKLTAMAAV